MFNKSILSEKMAVCLLFVSLLLLIKRSLMDEIIAEILTVNTGNDFVAFKAGKTELIAA